MVADQTSIYVKRIIRHIVYIAIIVLMNEAIAILLRLYVGFPIFGPKFTSCAVDDV